MKRAVLLGLLLFCAPLGVQAAQTLDYNFQGQVAGRWEGQGWAAGDAQKTPYGIHIRASSDGSIRTTLPTTFGAHTLSVTTVSPRPVEAVFLWESDGDGGAMVRLPVVIPASTEPKETRVDLTQYAQWNPLTTRIGFGLPKGADVTLVDLTLIRYTFLERLQWAARSVLHTDTFQIFSINFLWGPLIAFTPEEYLHTYEGQPPTSVSIMRFVYALLLLTVAAWWVLRIKGHTAKASLLLVSVVCGLWVLFDLRMSAELVGYGMQDWRTYLSKPAAERVFRDRLHYYRTMEQSTPWLQQTPQYGLLSPWPIMGNIRYFTYPSVPVVPKNADEGITHFIVFDDPTITLGADGRLLQNGTPVSAPGSIVQEFQPHTFLFQTR